ncbi:Tryptophan 2-halogenase [Purpureocillium lavendulum]|uniref:Tryptophan 2-halogenase n=1 Tax=Purpureocillium lavendulum TaxID=1247861 RepID=A0AB34FJ52_9HYPO|nr:Tryptophan 2-halogenase [Purpureocillium lavendulum]
MSTKYLKSRKFNQNFKNVAQWAYWQSDEVYGAGTHMEGAPYFEALEGKSLRDISTQSWSELITYNEYADASGWCWFMPLHDGTRSVGIVQDQTLATNKKRHLQHPSTQDFYMHSLALAPRCKRLLQDARLVGNVRSASDWSYTSSTYHLPYARICGDAGCFIDPLFSSGVHLAITGGLSAAVTISASLRGECDEHIAGSWHSKKTIESYTRFFLAVSSATKQIRSHDEPVLQDIDEVGFQRAFDLLRPIIQGSVDADGSEKMSQSDISEVLQFCFRAFTYVSPEKKDALFEKLKHLGFEAGDVNATTTALEDVKKLVTPEEWHVIETLRSRRMIREDPFDIESFTLDTIDGLAPRLERGNLGLTKAKKAKLDSSQFYSPSFLDGKVPGIREGTMHQPVA